MLSVITCLTIIYVRKLFRLIINCIFSNYFCEYLALTKKKIYENFVKISFRDIRIRADAHIILLIFNKILVIF